MLGASSCQCWLGVGLSAKIMLPLPLLLLCLLLGRGQTVRHLLLIRNLAGKPIMPTNVAVYNNEKVSSYITIEVSAAIGVAHLKVAVGSAACHARARACPHVLCAGCTLCNAPATRPLLLRCRWTSRRRTCMAATQWASNGTTLAWSLVWCTMRVVPKCTRLARTTCIITMTTPSGWCAAEQLQCHCRVAASGCVACPLRLCSLNVSAGRRGVTDRCSLLPRSAD